MRLGIEIQASQIFAAFIRRRSAHWELLGSFKQERSNDLRELRRQLPKLGIQTIVGLPQKNIFLKEIAVDRNLLSPEIELYFKKNIPKLFPEISKEFYFDFESLLSPSTSKPVRLVAAEKVWLDAFLFPLKKAGFRVMAADVDELAKIRGLPHLKRLPGPEFVTALGLALWEPSNEH